MNKNIRFITRTAILLAVAILFQFLGKFMGTYNNFIVGPIVNAVLIIAAEFVGIFSGLTISIVAPLVSAFTNKSAIGPIIMAFSPFIICGNAILVIFYSALKKKNRLLGIFLGAVTKFAFLYGAIALFAQFMGLKEGIAKSLTTLFSWPQLLTAIIGGIIALAIIPVMKRAIKD